MQAEYQVGTDKFDEPGLFLAIGSVGREGARKEYEGHACNVLLNFVLVSQLHLQVHGTLLNYLCLTHKPYNLFKLASHE